MTYKTHITALILVLILLVGCTRSQTLEMNYVVEYGPLTFSESDGEILKIDNTTPYEELITKTVDIHAFAQLFDPFGMCRDIDDVNAYAGIECLRKTEAGALYSVHKVEQGGLLYVFYHDKGEEIAGNDIVRWFYVAKLLSSSDFETLTTGVTTIDDVIRINPAEQIFLNIYRAYPNLILEGWLHTNHYLKNGVLNIGYEMVDGKLVLFDTQLAEDFDCHDMKESMYRAYDARILDIDWLK